MLDGHASVERVSVLLVILILGMITAKVKIVDEHVRKKLSDLLVYVTTPLLVISAFTLEFSQDKLGPVGLMSVISIAVHLFSIALGLLLFRNFAPERRAVIRYILVFSNSGFMGLPVLASLWGSSGVLYGAIYNIVSDVFMWTFGVGLFQRSRGPTSWRKVLINPGTIAVAVGLFIFLFSIDIPKPVQEAMELVGGMTAPLSMLVIGALLIESDLKKIFVGLDVYYISFVRLIFIPVVTLLALRMLGITGEVAAVCVAIVAMPAAANSVIFSEKFGGDSVFASRLVALSTLVSMVTIPLILLWLAQASI